MNKLIFLSFIFLGLIACSPTLTPFSQKLYDDQKWSLEELQKIQFYLSDDIVLYRKVASGETTIKNGKIKMVNGEKIEEILDIKDHAVAVKKLMEALIEHKVVNS